jgi:hypothetical protein
MSAALASTSSMFAVLLSRWNTGPEFTGPGSLDATAHMKQARRTLRAALDPYLPWMLPQDVALYDSLLRSPDANALSDQFFRCFDLMVRTRGTAIAVLRMHELFRLLQPHVTR